MQRIMQNKNNFLRTIYCIYLLAIDNLQGGHEVINLTIGLVLKRPKGIACAMTRTVVEKIELMVKRQGHKD